MQNKSAICFSKKKSKFLNSFNTVKISDAITKFKLHRGLRLVELLKQSNFNPYRLEDQLMLLFGAMNGFFDSFEVSQVKTLETFIMDLMRTSSYYISVYNEIEPQQGIQSELFTQYLQEVEQLFQIVGK